MVLDQSANFVRGTVSAAIASGDTTINVTDASIFPDPSNGAYNLVLWDTAQGRPDQDGAVEIVRVTGRDTTTDTLTVSRGQEGTSAASHPDSSALLFDATDKFLTDIDASLEALADFTASPTEVTAPVNNASSTTDDQTINNSVTYPDGTTITTSPSESSFITGNSASGAIQLSSGTAVIDTGVSATDATFVLALGVDDPNADAKVAGRLFWDDSVGTYHIEIVEDGTSVGNPTVNYDVVRVR